MGQIRTSGRRLVLLVVGLVAGAAACTSGQGGVVVSPGPGITSAGSTSSRPATTSIPSVPATTAAMASSDARPPLNLPQLADVVDAPAAPANRTDELSQQLAKSGQPTLQQAIDVYSLTIAPLPGATPSTLPPGNGFSLTNAKAYIAAYADQLTPAQAAVVKAAQQGVVVATAAGPDQPFVAVPATASSSAPPTTASRLRVAGRAFAAPDAPPDPTVVARYTALMKAARADWTAVHPELMAGIGPQALEFGGNNVQASNSTYDAEMDTSRGPVAGSCVFTVYPALLAENATNEYLQFVFAHEWFHCIQFTWSTAKHPDWLVEGSAMFAAMDLYRSTKEQFFKQRVQWFGAPGTSLGTEGAARGYEAWPLFEEMQKQTNFAYQSIKTMFSVPSMDVSALLAPTGLLNPTFELRWTSTAVRSTAFTDPDFTFAWPGTDPSFPSDQHDRATADGTRGLGTFSVTLKGPYRHVSYAESFSSDVGLVGVAPKAGPVLTHADSGSQTIADGQQRWFCVASKGCTCPPGEQPTMDLTPLTPPLLLSFTTQEGDSRADLTDLEWNPDRYCESTTPGARPWSPDQAATSNGDPHVTTFDGLPYDFMTLGEFVAAQDSTGGFVVQERHQPAGFGTAISAVALGDGTHRLTLTADTISSDAPITVRVDGTVTTADSATAGSMALNKDSDSAWTIAWTDGSLVSAHWNDGFFLTVQPSAARAAHVVGILGSPDGNMLDDLAMPDGTPAVAADHFQAYAQAWWVTQLTSLFDYQPGHTTETFRTAPADRPAAGPPTDQALGSCRTGLGAGATTAEINACAFDVTATGLPAFVSAYLPQVTYRTSVISVEPPASTPSSPIVVGTTAAPSPAGTTGSSPPSSAAGPATSTLTLSGTVPQDNFAPGAHPLAGRIHLVQGAVIVVRATCPSDNPNMTVEFSQTTPAGNVTSVGPGICGDMWETEVVNAGTSESHPGEDYLLANSTGDFDVTVKNLANADSSVSVTITADPVPAVVSEPLPAGGATKTLTGLGSSMVVLLKSGSGGSWSIAGGAAVCGAVSYATMGPTGVGPPTDLGALCFHHTAVSLGPASFDLPLVIFARTDGTFPITVTRTQ